LKYRKVHLDSAPAHNSKRSQEVLKATDAKRAPHLTYDRSDFFLFGNLKEQLYEVSVTDQNSPVSAITQFSNRRR
jgi:hypothetical protein